MVYAPIVITVLILSGVSWGSEVEAAKG